MLAGVCALREAPDTARITSDAREDFARRYPDLKLAPLVIVIAAYNEAANIGTVLDEVPDEIAGVPVALGATGGTARHSLAVDYALRPMFAYLKADIVPTTVFAAAEDFGAVSTDGDEDSLRARTARVATELSDYMLRFAGVTAGAVAPTRAGDKRGRRVDDDEFGDFVPMADLLGGRG